MATSGQYIANQFSNGRYAFINWQLATQEVGNNRSLINWQAYAHFITSDNQLDNGYANSNVGSLWSNGGRVKNYDGNLVTKDVALASGSFWVGHDSAGNGYLQLGVGITYYGTGRSEGTSGVWTLPVIPRGATVSSATSFNDEQDPSIYFNNPAGAGLDVWLEPNPSSTHLAVRTGIPNAGVYTWSLTTTERDALRAALATQNSATIRLGLYTSLSYTHDFVDYRDMTLSIINANPLFSNFTYRDSNSTTSAITGNDQYLIQGYSTLEVAIISANKATAQK